MDKLCALELLVDAGASLDHGLYQGGSALIEAARWGQTQVVPFLVAQGFDPNQRDDHGQSPLHYAARLGHAEAAEALIKVGAEVAAMDSGGHTPLAWAYREGHGEVIELLRREGKHSAVEPVHPFAGDVDLDVWFQVADELRPRLRSGDLDYCVACVSSRIRALPSSPYHAVLDAEFTNDANAIARLLDRFVEDETRRFDVKAIYAEANAFDINPDEWYFELFAYARYGGHGDYEWLCYWKSEECPQMKLAGMEPLQDVYRAKRNRRSSFRELRGLCSLLVVLKFQRLMRRGARLAEKIAVPFLSTAHDYDFIYEFSPHLVERGSPSL